MTEPLPWDTLTHTLFHHFLQQKHYVCLNCNITIQHIKFLITIECGIYILNTYMYDIHPKKFFFCLLFVLQFIITIIIFTVILSYVETVQPGTYSFNGATCSYFVLLFSFCLQNYSSYYNCITVLRL